MDSQDEIRARIRERLADLGLAVKTASVEAGLGETTLRNYLEGMTKSLTVRTANKLAVALKVSPDWILYGSDSKLTPFWQREAIAAMEDVPDDRRDQLLDIIRTFRR